MGVTVPGVAVHLPTLSDRCHLPQLILRPIKLLCSTCRLPGRWQANWLPSGAICPLHSRVARQQSFGLTVERLCFHLLAEGLDMQTAPTVQYAKFHALYRNQPAASVWSIVDCLHVLLLQQCLHFTAGSIMCVPSLPKTVLYVLKCPSINRYPAKH